MTGGNAMFWLNDDQSLCIRNPKPGTREGMVIEMAGRGAHKWSVVFHLSPQDEADLLHFLLMRAPRPDSVKQPEAPKQTINPQSTSDYWTPERRAAQAEKMRALRARQTSENAA